MATSKINKQPTSYFIQRGRAHIPSAGYVGVTFPTPFDSVPYVIATRNNSTGEPNAREVSVMSITTTGFTIILNPAVETDAEWLAIE